MVALKLFFRRCFVEVFGFILDHLRVLNLIGKLNKKWNFIESISLIYPANDGYTDAYLFSHRARKSKWSIWPVGILIQNGKIGIKFCITSTNEDFINPQNQDRLRVIVKRLEELRLLLGAKQKTFAGILAGLLYAKRIIREAPEAELTAEAVVLAIKEIKRRELLSNETPVVVLGGRGFIGRRVVKLLGGSTYSIDPKDNGRGTPWPSHLEGTPLVVVNIANTEAISNYLGVMWPGTIVLNEVYPEPTKEILSEIADKQGVCYHVVGVKACAFPAFPMAYEGAIPCCTGWPSPELKAVVKKL